MSETQLLLPEPAADENAVVSRFVQASRDIVPNIEVTLAKRIIRPGSNRVVCLAARTSVPLNEDDVASVSDLALRLSDGTNVALSLSFFNDLIGGNCIPLTPCIQDANRYELRSDSNLGLVLFVVSCLAMSGLYYMVTGPFSASVGARAALSTAFGHFGSSSKHTSVPSPVLLAPKHAVSHDKTQWRRSPDKGAIGNSKPVRAVKRFKAARNPHVFQNFGLVPPPPAIYSLPDPPAYLTIDRATAGAKPKASTSGTVNPDSVLLPPASAAPRRLPEDNKGGGTKAMSEAKRILELHPTQANVDPDIEGYVSGSAPLPGNSAATPQLERIALPGQ